MSFLNELQNKKGAKKAPPADVSPLEACDLYNFLQVSPFNNHFVLLDVRPSQAFQESRLPFSVHLDLSEHDTESLANVKRLSTLPASEKRLKFVKNLKILVCGETCDLPMMRALQVLCTEREKAPHVRVLEGGLAAFAEIYPFMFLPHDAKRLPKYPSEILERRLFLGSAPQAVREDMISALRITHVVNATKEVPNQFEPDVAYHRVAIDDLEEEDLAPHIDGAVDFITGALDSKSGGADDDDAKEQQASVKEGEKKASRVLVHCEYGISRSSSLVMAYLMKSRGWTFETAHAHVKARRFQVSPNDGFRKTLLEYQESLKA